MRHLGQTRAASKCLSSTRSWRRSHCCAPQRLPRLSFHRGSGQDQACQAIVEEPQQFVETQLSLRSLVPALIFAVLCRMSPEAQCYMRRQSLQIFSLHDRICALRDATLCVRYTDGHTLRMQLPEYNQSVYCSLQGICNHHVASSHGLGSLLDACTRDDTTDEVSDKPDAATSGGSLAT